MHAAETQNGDGGRRFWDLESQMGHVLSDCDEAICIEARRSWMTGSLSTSPSGPWLMC